MSWPRSLALCVASGLLLALALPLAIPFVSLHELDPAGHLEWLAWVGLVPALFALQRAPGWKSAFALGLAAGLAYFYAAIWWVNHAMTSFGGVPLPTALAGLSLLVLYMAFHWALAFALARAIGARLRWPLWAVLPPVWVAAELSRNYLFTGFPWANLGYLQARHPLPSQLAALGGVYLVAALLVLVNGVVHALLEARLARRPVPWRVAGAGAAAVALSLGWGAVHLRQVRAAAAAAPKLKVGLVQGNVNQSVKNEMRQHGSFILGRFLPLTAEADRRGADLVAWPEASFPWLVSPELGTFELPTLRFPRLTHAHLLLGAVTSGTVVKEDGRRELVGGNSVFLAGPDLKVLGRYQKHHLVPFGEYVPLQEYLPFIRQVVPPMVPQVPGAQLRTLSYRGAEGEVRIAPMICFDAIFPEVSVALARQRPDLLVNPTNDAWYGYSSGPYQFLAIVRLRAIETMRAVARPAYAGVSALVLPTGELAPGAIDLGPVDPDLAPDPEEPARLLVGEVPRMSGETLYTRTGDVFAYACVAFTLAGLATLAMRRRERSAAPHPARAPGP
ncbi:apolipoprotein N-acyltransferase [Anaeromyxobacter paludicola]|uniref:Apolipoprotein N-acyltransferase n=1 Tax=Anaeromyxobacter paludicola TaxID=2918171 RepID=A0ABN6N6W3_9BACT|nr:apolipoprotein N-acyltransferase [Anaeromyxobacter paludicola]BDG08275.1 apolipoprotein N-acyltransferase [Anaeromyxobacter paludicola]